ncbi:MAG: GatB/YqeY domain-containing protein, partial [Acidobacteriota bacterium]
GRTVRMTFLERINEDLKNAMKNKEADRLSTLRMVKTALKNREIEKMAPLEDAEAIKVLQTLVKQRRDSAEQYRQAGRQELADREVAEIAMIEDYLPAAVDEATIARLVDETIAEVGATSAKEMGLVMKGVMAKLAGQTVDGKVVNQLVKARLG